MIRAASIFPAKPSVLCLSLLFFPLTGWAQQAAHVENVPEIRIAAENSSILQLPENLNFPALLADTQNKSRRTRAQSNPPAMKRERIDPSMVGYLDDPTVISEVRVRFDAGFNDPRPDRAEYFYCGCAAIGPSAAVQRTLNFQQLYFQAEYAASSRLSGFVELPFRWIQPTFYPYSQPIPASSVDSGGISDVTSGVKFAAIASEVRDLALELTAGYPTGSGAKGLGTGHYSLIPAAIYYQKLSGRAGIEAEINDSHPIGGFVNPASSTGPARNFSGDVMMYGIGPGYKLIEHPAYTLAPVLELVAWHVFGGLQTDSAGNIDSAAGINVFNAKLGARISFTNGGSFYAGYGRAVTSDIWYKNLFRAEYRYSF